MSKVIRERDAEVAREAILKAAEEVFAREGFDGARIDTIAAEAGYNKSLIFHYFGDKEGLYQAIVSRMKSRLNDEFLEPLVGFAQYSQEMSFERMRIFLEMSIERYFAFLTSHPNILRIMAWEAAEGWHTFLDKHSKELEQHKASLVCLSDFLRRGQEVGVVSKELDARFLTMTIGNMCIMYLLNLPRYQGFMEENAANRPDELVDIRRQIVHLVLYGIFTLPRERTQ